MVVLYFIYNFDVVMGGNEYSHLPTPPSSESDKILIQIMLESLSPYNLPGSDTWELQAQDTVFLSKSCN